MSIIMSLFSQIGNNGSIHDFEKTRNQPLLVHFCQQTMRHEYNEFIDRDLKEFKTNFISNQTVGIV